jgi:hypothetical protein
VRLVNSFQVRAACGYDIAIAQSGSCAPRFMGENDAAP